MIEMTLDRFFEIADKMQAFKQRDWQMLNVIRTWSKACGFTWEEMVQFSVMSPLIDSLNKMHYFSPAPSVEQMKEIRAYEKSLPKEIRSQVRKIRLQKSWGGKLHD